MVKIEELNRKRSSAKKKFDDDVKSFEFVLEARPEIYRLEEAFGPFHLIYTPPYGREFLRGFEKAVSEGLCALASFDLCVFSEG